jgi:calcium-dependent protein kinase
MRQILLAVSYLHHHGIAHRDLKLENVMYDSTETDHLKLIDFGFSSSFRRRRFKTVCGTLSYVAPEVLEENYGSQCDLWSAGVIAFILLAGCMPFYGSKADKMKAISGGKYFMKPKVWDPISSGAKDFVNSLLENDPEDRLDAKGALAHPWIAAYGHKAGKKHVPTLSMDCDILGALASWQRAPKFVRACFMVMAWHLDKEEHVKVRDYFLQLDRDQNGTISMGQLRSMMIDRFGIDEATVNQTLRNSGSSDDEEINYSTFLAALMSNRIIDVDDSLLHTAFRKFDEANKGFITAKDFKHVAGDEYYDRSTSLLLEPDASGKTGDGHVGYDKFSMYINIPSTLGSIEKDHENELASIGKGKKNKEAASQRHQNRKKVEEVSQPACCTLM